MASRSILTDRRRREIFTKAAIKITCADCAGAPATAGNLVFHGHYEGTFSPYDAKAAAG